MAWTTIPLTVVVNKAGSVPPPAPTPTPTPDPTPIPAPVEVHNVVSVVGTNVMAALDTNPTAIGPERGTMGFAGIVSNGSHAFAPNLGVGGATIVTGGGHNDYGGNDVVAYLHAEAMWVRLCNPSLSATSATDPNIDWVHGELPDGSPMACHTFNVLTVIPGGTNGKGLLLRVAAPALGVGSGAASAGFAHVFDLGKWNGTPIEAKDGWSRFSTNACDVLKYASSPVPSFHCVDEVANVAWCGYAGGYHASLAKLDLATRTYSMVKTTSSNWGYMPVACAHPVRGLMLWVSSFGAYQTPQSFKLKALDLANPGRGAIDLTTQGDTIPTAKITCLGGYMSPWAIDWDTTNDCGQITTGDDEPGFVYRVDAPTSGDVTTQPWTITKVALSAPLPTLAMLDSPYGHWRYAKPLKAFTFVAKVTQQLALFSP